jgi:hypothetical protein
VNGLYHNYSRADRRGNSELIQAIAQHLSGGKSTGGDAAHTVVVREEEAQRLIAFLEENAFYTQQIDAACYLTEGAEQKVYFQEATNTVLKVNSGVFYTSWADYFHSLLLHNFFFPDTAYTFLGMHKEGDYLCAVVEQPFIKTTELTNLQRVKSFLSNLNFINNRNNDYKNHELGIIIEDLHDENVLTNNDILYFIDTVFYVLPQFYNSPIATIFQ